MTDLPGGATGVMLSAEAPPTPGDDDERAREGGGENHEASGDTKDRTNSVNRNEAEEYFDDRVGCGDEGDEGVGGAGGDDGNDNEGKSDGDLKASPQAKWEFAAARHPSLGSEGELVDCKLSPLDIQNQKQNLKDVLMSANVIPPPLPGKSNNNEGSHHVQFAAEEEDYRHHQSVLHQDEYPQYNHDDSKLHNPQNHESSLLASGSSCEGPQSSSSKLVSPFKARKKNRLVPGKGSVRGHSHPRKSPYKSEVARLRHAQQLERQKRQFSKDPPDDASRGSSASGRSVGIKDTTSPPDTAFFSIQSSKFKHSLLHSLGEFLTSAFADDEESSGSYFSQDLLDQLSISNPHLRGVWLQAKNLNDEHVRKLSEALLRNKVVTELWLPSNKITDVGAAHIAHMLKFNRSIKELFLGENDIGPRGAAALASALARGNTSLVALGLGDNRIGVEGAGAFAAALRHNHSLHTLDVKNNGIPTDSSIRSLLNKMLEFNASDPGDESLVLGLQEELAGLVSSLPPHAAEKVVLRAESALKEAMLCRRRGDRVGAAEAEGVFIRICTTGQPPVDPPGEAMWGGKLPQKQQRPSAKKKKGLMGATEPDRLDGLEGELATLAFNEGPMPAVTDEGEKKDAENVVDDESLDGDNGGNLGREPTLVDEGRDIAESNAVKQLAEGGNEEGGIKAGEKEKVTITDEKKASGNTTTEENASRHVAGDSDGNSGEVWSVGESK